MVLQASTNSRPLEGITAEGLTEPWQLPGYQNDYTQHLRSGGGGTRTGAGGPVVAIQLAN